jgi:hypothetical protein
MNNMLILHGQISGFPTKYSNYQQTTPFWGNPGKIVYLRNQLPRLYELMDVILVIHKTRAFEIAPCFLLCQLAAHASHASTFSSFFSFHLHLHVLVIPPPSPPPNLNLNHRS